MIPGSTDRVPMMKFDVSAGKSDVTLKKLELNHIGFGSEENVTNVTVYNSKNEKISDGDDFSDTDLDVALDNGVVVKAGETETFTIAANIATGSTRTTYQIELAGLVSSAATIEGLPLKGAILEPVTVSNVGTITVTADKATSDVKVGTTSKLAGFKIEETSDNEDVLVKAITLTLSGTADREYFSNLELYADGKKVASDVSFNSDDEVTFNPEFTITKDDKVTFEVKGTITGDVGESFELVIADSSDIYVVGARSGYNISGASVVDISDVLDVEGAAINVSFTKSELDEVKPDTTGVNVGTLKLLATSDDYKIRKITVTVTGTGLEDLELGGYNKNTSLSTGDDSGNNGAGTYVYKDIVLTAGQELSMDLVADIMATANDGVNLTFAVAVTEVEDIVNDVTYTSSTTPNLSKILSSVSFDSKTIAIEKASLDTTTTTITNSQLVLGDQEVVVYKGKFSVSDSDSVKMSEMNFTPSGSYTTSTGAGDSVAIALDDVIASAKLTIGDKVYNSTDVEDANLEFKGLDHVFTAGSKNVEVVLTVKLKELTRFNGTGNLVLTPTIDSADLEDSNGDDVTGGSRTLTAATTLTLRETGTLRVDFNTDEDKSNLTDVNKFALAGTNNVVLAKVEFEPKYENAKVKELSFISTGSTDFTDTLKNVKLVDAAGNTLVSNAQLTQTATGTKIKFNTTFTLTKDVETVALLVADINPITDAQGVTSATSGVMHFELLTGINNSDLEGAVSADDYQGADLITNVDYSKNVTIVSNTVAGVTLTAATSDNTYDGSEVNVAKLKLDMTTQNVNKTNDAKDVTEAAFTAINLKISGDGVTASGSVVSLKRAGVTASGTVDTNGLVTISSNNADFYTVDDGSAEYVITITPAAVSGDSVDRSVTVKIADVTSDLTIKDKAAGNSINLVYSSKAASTDKERSVTVK